MRMLCTRKHKSLLLQHETGCSIFSTVLDQTTGFYWSYTLLLKSLVLMCSCFSNGTTFTMCVCSKYVNCPQVTRYTQPVVVISCQSSYTGKD